jgi:hypothetical protein
MLFLQAVKIALCVDCCTVETTSEEMRQYVIQMLKCGRTRNRADRIVVITVKALNFYKRVLLVNKNTNAISSKKNALQCRG